MFKPTLQNTLIAGLAIVVGLVGLYGAWGMDLGSLRRIGQGAFPLAMSILLLLLGIAALYAKPDLALIRPLLRPLVFVSASMIAFAVALPHLGLALAVMLAAGICALASSESRALETVLLGIVLAAGFAALFIYGLGLNIPLWPE